MSRLRNKTDAQQAHIQSLWVFVVILIVALGYSMFGWNQSPDHIRVYVPPDLRAGVEMGVNEIPPANVYAFTHYIFQQLYHWPVNGREDFPGNIKRLSGYFTPQFLAEILAEMDLKGADGELKGRVRTMQEMTHFNNSRVTPVGNDTWTVMLDYKLVETVNGMEVKSPAIRYPLRVVRYAVDPDHNAWGLAIDGYAKNPTRLTEEDLAAAQPSLDQGGS